MFSFCRHLKSDQNHADLPILLLASTNCRTYRLAALRSGVDDVLDVSVGRTTFIGTAPQFVAAGQLGEDRKIQNRTLQAFGMAEQQSNFVARSKILISAESTDLGRRWQSILRPQAPYGFTYQAHADVLKT